MDSVRRASAGVIGWGAGRTNLRPMKRSLTALIALAMLALIPASGLAASATPTPAPGLSFLHVGAVGGPAHVRQVVDGHGRLVLLRGVNVYALVDHWRQDLKRSYPVGP